MSALSIQGVSSSAGKSLVATALARAFHRRGVRVAPFKAQNMSNNARVVDGGEIGVAQYLQARAAGIEPDVRMNPILVKPEGDDRSQLVVLGQGRSRPQPEVAGRERPPTLWPVAKRALGELLVGVRARRCSRAPGSPAETNLRSTRPREHALGARGSAHRSCSWPTSTVAVRSHISRERGRWSTARGSRARSTGSCSTGSGATSLCSLPRRPTSQQATGMRYVGAAALRRPRVAGRGRRCQTRSMPSGRRVGIVRYPTASNLDEFKLLEQVARCQLGRRVRLVGSRSTWSCFQGRSTSLPTSTGSAGAGVPQRSSLTRGGASGSRNLRRPADAR